MRFKFLLIINIIIIILSLIYVYCFCYCQNKNEDFDETLAKYFDENNNKIEIDNESTDENIQSKFINPDENMYIKNVIYNESFFEYNNGYNNNNNLLIPKVIYQTYYNKNKIPQKVYDNIKKYAPDYKQIIYDDKECIEFLKKNYGSNVLDAFIALKLGAHKADLFRYCVIYKMGGVYLDIKTILLKPLSSFINNNYLYTALTYKANENKIGYIYQGIIASPPNNPIFLKLIRYIVENANDVHYYSQFIKNFYDTLKEEVNDDLHFGKNISPKGKTYYLLEERYHTSGCETYDRYNLCSFIYNGKEKIIKTRYDDFPWK